MHPSGLPFDPEPERIAQTHANYVLLRGDRAYKLKKPVRFPFLDYSTLERRRTSCLAEIRLNRRFAPDIYLGVAEVHEERGRLRIGPALEDLPPAAESVRDYAVVMRRIPDGAWLPEQIRRGAIGEDEIVALLRQLIEVYRSHPASDEVRANGRPERLRKNTVDNIAECRRFVPQCLTLASWRRLDRLLREWFEANHDVFEQRVREDRIRDGHGDLKPSNIAFVDGKPIVTDCIEFDPLFRWLDTLCEVSFLATGLESLDAFDIAARVLSVYRDVNDDRYPPRLRRYYQAHLACVMGKVSALQLDESEIDEMQKQSALQLARKSFALADFHAREPHVIVVGGIMGCGKTTVANAIADAFGWTVVSSDIERKRLAGMAPTARLPASGYSDEMTRRTYARLAEAASKADSGIILDGQFPRIRERDLVRRAVEAAGGSLLFVLCDAPDAVIRERMRRRAEDPRRTSDATEDLLGSARNRFEPLSSNERATAVDHDTREEVAEAVHKVRSALLRCELVD